MGKPLGHPEKKRLRFHGTLRVGFCLFVNQCALEGPQKRDSLTDSRVLPLSTGPLLPLCATPGKLTRSGVTLMAVKSLFDSTPKGKKMKHVVEPFQIVEGASVGFSRELDAADKIPLIGINTGSVPVFLKSQDTGCVIG